MTEVSESVKDKIRKLLAKADNTACTVEEARAFNDKAFELMAKYNLDRAMIEPKNLETFRTHKELMVQVRPWSNAILHGLCKLYLCKWHYRRLGRTDTVIIVGEEQNVAVCHALAVMILRAVQQEARYTGGGRSFLTGAGYKIFERANELILERKKTLDRVNAKNQTNALMVLEKNEDEENRKYQEELAGGKIKKAKKSKAQVRDAHSYHAGAEFGSKLPLNQGQLS